MTAKAEKREGDTMSKADTLRAVDKREIRDAARQTAKMNKARFCQTDRLSIRFSKNQITLERSRERG